MNDAQLQTRANNLAQEVGELIQRYRQNAPERPGPSGDMHEEDQRYYTQLHAQQLQQHTQELWEEFNETYRADCLEVLAAFDERGFDTGPIRQGLEAGTDPQMLQQLVKTLQVGAANLDRT